MKKLLFAAIIGLGLYSQIQAAQVVVNATTNGVYLLSTNRASVYSIEITGSNPGTVTLYDADTLVVPLYGTNYTNAAWVSRTTFPTNYVYSTTNLQGIVSWYTNAGVWTATTTNAAATNTLPVMGSFVVAGGTYAVYNLDALFARGITAQISTNISVVVNYRSGQ